MNSGETIATHWKDLRFVSRWPQQTYAKHEWAERDSESHTRRWRNNEILIHSEFVCEVMWHTNCSWCPNAWIKNKISRILCRATRTEVGFFPVVFAFERNDFRLHWNKISGCRWNSHVSVRWNIKRRLYSTLLPVVDIVVAAAATVVIGISAVGSLFRLFHLKRNANDCEKFDHVTMKPTYMRSPFSSICMFSAENQCPTIANVFRRWTLWAVPTNNM